MTNLDYKYLSSSSTVMKQNTIGNREITSGVNGTVDIGTKGAFLVSNGSLTTKN